MQLTVHSVCGRLPAWVSAGVDEYQRRLPRELNLVWRDLPLARRTRSSKTERLCQQEGEQLLKGLSANDTLIALDVRGKALATEALAESLQAWQMSGCGVSFLIGGPDGLSSQCLQRAGQRWSLGRLTLPHPLVRVVLAEQLYRAWTIIAGHPYHRG